MKRAAKRILEVLTTDGCQPVELGADEVQSWLQRWRSVFARQLHAKTKLWVQGNLDWHVFSLGYHASLTADAARNAYRAVESSAFVVLGADVQKPFGFLCQGKPPERLKAGFDVLVAPTSLAWTMAFTHEEPVAGPYFANRDAS